ncbi:3-ketosteroid-delta-1-dehydrogenase [Rhodococcus qingshengii]|uniref:3-ketosteroid-delta-1-dehydrogenase n=1 Tax=Rhodococcus qingshengii TaxID=334542 RepID=UPI0024B97EBE|nr:3-ketosteroid-delta-1-dehydrogenase [Rhodococcus qingshengii]MDJ0432112.1 3-ketosteroid-delta-1-dehydrogenase [Rhodococcus qingshengii]
MAKNQAPPATQAKDIVVDLLVIGSGTGMAAALTANELGLSTLIVEKTQYVGGSTARSGGAFWMPANPILAKAGAGDTVERAKTYVRSVVGDTAPAQRGEAFVDNGAATVDMLYRTTPMKFFWAKEYSDYHPELPGGSAAGRTCECLPFDASVLGAERGRLRPGLMEAGLPMPVTGADYKWMNLMVKKPSKAFPRIIRRLAQGVYGKYVLKREYIAGGQALAAGLFAGVVQAGIPVWTETSLVRLITEDGRVTGAVVVQDGREVTVTARRGVVLAAGGFDHNMEWRHKYQSESLGEHESLGAEGNTGEAIEAAQELGAGIGSMDQSWWFPAVASIKGRPPMVMLAERALPGSFIVDQTGRRFVNEATDYMSFGQRVLEREKAGDPAESMWFVFDQEYRNSYVFAGGIFPRQPLPQAFFDSGIAHKASSPVELARKVGLPEEAFVESFEKFNEAAAAGSDAEFGRGGSAYDRYYGDPTVSPNPNLRKLDTSALYAVKMTLSDLGTCGGVQADEHARVLREDGSVIDGLYAIGNTAANAFGHTYPGAGATIGQGLVYGYIAAHHAAEKVASTQQ